jgi:hypothetical protein
MNSFSIEILQKNDSQSDTREKWAWRILKLASLSIGFWIFMDYAVVIQSKFFIKTRRNLRKWVYKRDWAQRSDSFWLSTQFLLC